ncbi:MAG: hypothetical protein D4Q77_00450 [Methanothrix sp.]|nr:MAG: hypothetical protein D4Q77_00450 [Methanothrix sp.]
MTSFRAWQITTATIMHFNGGSYDAKRFNFKAKNLTVTAFEKRRERTMFERFSGRYTETDMIRFAFANVFFGEKNWIGDMDESSYLQYSKRIQSFGYHFTSDLKKLSGTSLNQLMSPLKGNIPEIIQRYLQGAIMTETIIGIHCITNFLQLVSPKITDDLLWPDIKMRLLKATAFIGPDLDQKRIAKLIALHLKKECTLVT